MKLVILEKAKPYVRNRKGKLERVSGYTGRLKLSEQKDLVGRYVFYGKRDFEKPDLEILDKYISESKTKKQSLFRLSLDKHLKVGDTINYKIASTTSQDIGAIEGGWAFDKGRNALYVFVNPKRGLDVSYRNIDFGDVDPVMKKQILDEKETLISGRYRVIKVKSVKFKTEKKERPVYFMEEQ